MALAFRGITRGHLLRVGPPFSRLSFCLSAFRLHASGFGMGVAFARENGKMAKSRRGLVLISAGIAVSVRSCCIRNVFEFSPESMR